MKECCQTCKLRYEAHQTDFRKLGTDEHIDSIIDDAFICMAFAYEGIANLMVGTDPNLGLCEVYTPKTEQTEPNCSEKPNNCEELNAYRECIKSRSFWDSKHCDGCYFDERCPFDEPKDEPQTENLFTDKYGDVWEWRGDAWYCISGQDEPTISKMEQVEPQTDCAWK